MAGSKVARYEGQNLKGKALGFDHEEARKSQSDHGTPVVKGTLGETRPAAAAADEAYIED